MYPFLNVTVDIVLLLQYGHFTYYGLLYIKNIITIR